MPFSVMAMPARANPIAAAPSSICRKSTSVRATSRARAAMSRWMFVRDQKCASYTRHKGCTETSNAPPLSSPRRWLSSTSVRSSGDGFSSLPASLRREISLFGRYRLKICSKRSISRRTRRIVRRANAASGCHRESSDSAPSTSPCHVWNRAFGAVARTVAMTTGTPATAAMTRKKRRRVGRPSLSSGIGYPDADRHWLAAPLGGPHQWRTSRVVVILDLAIEALKALGRDDLAGGLDRAHGTSTLAEMAGAAAFGTTLQQIEQVQPIKQCEHATEWAQETAIGSLREESDGQQRTGIEHIWPCARESCGDRRLERLDLQRGPRWIDLRHHQREHSCGSDVLAHPQALLQRNRRIPLRHPQRAGNLREQFLQGPERAQPAAEHAAPNQYDGDERVASDDDHQRLGQVETQLGVIERRPAIVEDIHDRELHTGGPPEPDENNQQESCAHEPMRHAVTRQRRLENEDQREHRQQHGENHNVYSRLIPCLDPCGDRRRKLRLGLRNRLRLLLRWRRDDRRTRDLEYIGVRDLVVEPKCDSDRRTARAVDQNFQSPRLQRVEA